MCENLQLATAVPPFNDSLRRAYSRSNPSQSVLFRNCTFEISMRTGLARLPLEGWTAELLYATLPFLGIRSWIFDSMLEVRGDKLQGSRTIVAEGRWGTSDSYQGLIPFGYEVVSVPVSDWRDTTYDYRVGFPHITGPPANILKARVAQTPFASMQRVFDVHLSCLSAVFRDCRGFDELAPSAWADYSARLSDARRK